MRFYLSFWSVNSNLDDNLIKFIAGYFVFSLFNIIRAIIDAVSNDCLATTDFDQGYSKI